ncbi:hypothetical protein C882_3691 [Caenispirillum salinarum AK4]|uniref:Uncharacterized protein n=1 Tax=Caenispirillum salinarum AK4 TaxID=1238182 RepID=K9HLU4_9PROT|nr:hypothetical protein [Caenispirillum salinarum]EKV31318.1 hypothetical protein C882_3691 [Caenispirillum salinarum AK4]
MLMMVLLLLLAAVWAGVFAIARLVAPTAVSALGASAFVAFLGGRVAAADYGLWWGDMLTAVAAAGILAFLAVTVRSRLRG